MDGRQGAGAGALLLLGVAGAGRALGAGEDAARGQDQDVAVRELLLELPGEAAWESVAAFHCQLSERVRNLPLLDTVEALQGRDGDKDDNSLLAVANLDLFQTKSQHASSRTSLGPLPVLFLKSQ